MSVVSIQLAPGFPPQLVAVGSSHASAALHVEQAMRGTSAGRSTATAQLGQAGALSLAGRAAGLSTPTASLRLNNEPNVLLAGRSSMTTSLAATIWLRLAGLAGVASGASSASGRLSLDAADEFGFTFFIEVLAAGLASSTRERMYTARLTDSGAEVPIRSVTESAPRGALGVSLSVQLATPEASLVSASADLTFEIGVWDGSAWAWAPVMEGGRLAGAQARYANDGQRPADSVSFSTLDVLADRWTLRPAAPLTLYDSSRVEAPRSPDASDVVIDDATGGGIYPVALPWPGLTLRGVLRQAYVTGCRFARVVTNLPDFRVAQAEFTLEGGWHAGAVGHLALFEPLYFSPDGSSLWIIDPDAPLPAGLEPLVLTEADVREIESALPARQPVSAVIVSYVVDTEAGDYYTERLETPPAVETGSFGSPNYTRTEVERRVREWRNLSAPERVVREEIVETTTRTLDWNFILTGRVFESDQFDALGRKVGHTRTVEARVPDLADDGRPRLQLVTSERYSVIYRAGAAPGTDEIERTVRETSGLVLIDPDKPYLGRPYELPYADAHRSGYIDPDSSQTAEFRAISTRIDTYVREGAGVAVRRSVLNFLNNAGSPVPETGEAETRAGSIALNRRAQRTVRRLLKVPGAEARLVPTINAGELAGDLAVRYGWRKLARLNSPPRNVTATLPYIDFRVRRGSIVELRGRGGARLGLFIVEGYTRSIAALGERGQGFSMTIQGREIGGAA